MRSISIEVRTVRQLDGMEAVDCDDADEGEKRHAKVKNETGPTHGSWAVLRTSST